MSACARCLRRGALLGQLVPWIERRFTHDDAEHHLLDRPRDNPVRTGLGAAATSFVAILFIAGSQDVIAGTLHISIGHVTSFLQISAIVAPPIVYVVTSRVCRALGGRPGAERTERAGAVEREPDGGYHGVHEEQPLAVGE